MRNRVAILIPAGALLAGCGLMNGCGPKNNAPTVAPAAATTAPGIGVTFVDIAKQADITFVHNNGAFGAKLLPETMGPGIGFIDFDGDGFQDIVIVNGRDWTPAEIQAFKSGTGKTIAGTLPSAPPARGGTCTLYHNNGNGTFTDVTAASGLAIPMMGMGVAVADYDNDGKDDILITTVGGNYLFHNEGGGKFKEVGGEAGVKDSGWSTSAAWVDYDKDGTLDLFVCRYVAWTPATDIYSTMDGKNKSYTTPEQYTGLASRLYHNEGKGKFKDVSATAGIQTRAASSGAAAKGLQGKSLGVTICDFDGDGWPDIVVANDTEPNYALRNNHNGTFTEQGGEIGIAFNEAGIARAAMGTDAADIDHSGKESLLFGNFANQMLGVYQNIGGRLFIDIAPSSEIGQASLQFLTFGATFLDFDNDGWMDIFTANGHLDEEINHIQRDVTYMERPLLFRNAGIDPVSKRVRYQQVGLQSGEPFNKKVVARGLAYADIDMDGDVDVALTTNGGPIELLRNDGGNKNGSIRVVLVGTKSNRNGIGAVIEAKAGTETERRTVRSGSSYCSASEIPVTLGLGAQPKLDSLTITWPSGEHTELKDVAANQIVTIEEGKGITKQQPFAHR